MKEFDRKTLANNIKELRKNRKLNQVELAKQLNVSQQTVGAWETGRAIPGSDTLDMLANYFGVTTDYLLGRNGLEDQKEDAAALTWADLDMPMPYGGKIPDDLKETYIDLAKSYFKRHPEMLNKNNK